jgi:RNA polymerase sigma-70 factor (ECF subfamily)
MRRGIIEPLPINQAFPRFALDGLPAARVTREPGMSETAVVRAKSRILKRLREEAGELLD